MSVEVKFTFGNVQEAMALFSQLSPESEPVKEITPYEKKVLKAEKAPAPVVEEKVVEVVEEKVAPVMPAPPSFIAQVEEPVQESIACPFNDEKGMISYVMESYKALGPQKGIGIQTVLTNLGYQNIKDVKAEDYGKLYQAVEGLK